MTKLLLLCAFAGSLAAQQGTIPQPPPVVPAPAPYLPDNWMGAGAAWNQYSKPQVAGWASYAKLISRSAQLYSFTSWDVTSATANSFSSQTSARTGLAMLVRQFGPVSVLGIGDIGMATSASALGGAFAGGGIALIRLRKTQFTIELAARLLKISGQPNQVVYELGLGRVSEN